MTKSNSTGPYIRRYWERCRTITKIEGESRTQATDGNETDVNKIMARFTRTGHMPLATKEAQYADVTELQSDMTEILERGRQAFKEWENLNNEARTRIKNQTEREKQPKIEQTPEGESDD